MILNEQHSCQFNCKGNSTNNSRLHLCEVYDKVCTYTGACPSSSTHRVSYSKLSP